MAPATRQPYVTLLHSLGTLFARHPRLRASAFTQAFLAVAFSGFWSTVALHLTGTIGLSAGQAGLLGLAGAAGALGASIAGRLSGRVAPGHIVAGGALLMAATFAAMALFPHSLPAIVIGTLLFDVGVQAALVSHQTIIYALAPEARSRINAVFMTIMFIGIAGRRLRRKPGVELRTLDRADGVLHGGLVDRARAAAGLQRAAGDTLAIGMRARDKL